VILKIVEKFKRDNDWNIKNGYKALNYLDLDKRLTDAGCVVETRKVIEISNSPEPGKGPSYRETETIYEKNDKTLGGPFEKIKKITDRAISFIY